jgi:hypothetical protein
MKELIEGRFTGTIYERNLFLTLYQIILLQN